MKAMSSRIIPVPRTVIFIGILIDVEGGRMIGNGAVTRMALP